MPSTYSPPDAIVYQKRITQVADAFLPQLPVVVVAPARQIVVKQPAGVYAAGEALTVPFPGLASGATLIQDSVSILLEAKLNSGKAIGFFKVDALDYDISDDGTQFTIHNDIGLEYSLLSKRNNAGTLIANDSGSAKTSAITFYDKQVDFLSRGATADGDSFIIIRSPANQVGRYKIFNMLTTGTKVNTVWAELVDENDDPILSKSVSVLGAAQPTGRIAYGFPDNHELGNDFDENILAGDIGLGVGVKAQVGSDFTGSAITTLFHANINIPDGDSGDAVTFAPDSTGQAAAGWSSLVNNAKVGDYLRITFAHTYTTPDLVRDFKINSIDKTNKSFVLQNEDFTGTGTESLAAASVHSIQILEVLKGSDDAANASGDVLTGEVSGVPFSAEIKRATPGFVELVTALPTLPSSSNTVVTMRRGVPYAALSSTYDLTKKITTGFTATALASFQAQRSDLALNGLIEVSDMDSVEQIVGMAHPDNTAALLADMVIRSGLTNPAQTFYILVTADDTIEAYEDAITVLERNEVYFVVPGTQDGDILDLFVNHVTAQSLPQNKHERVCLITTPIITSELKIPALPTDNYAQGIAQTLTPKVFTSNSVDWTLATAGDVLKVMSSADPATATVLASYRIQSINATAGTCTTLDNIDSTYLGSNQYFRVDSYPYDQNLQAQAWRDEAASYKNMRVCLIRPDKCEIQYTDKTGDAVVDKEVIVPSFYLAAMFAGLNAALPPEQPMTNVPLPGINRLFNSNEHFTPEQLNTIAEGGNMIFEQLTRQGAPLCRHQLTTDMTTLSTREFSIIKSVDAGAKYLRAQYRKYIGNHNITAEYLTQLRGIGEALIKNLVNAGTWMPDTSLDKLYQDDTQPDQIIVDITVYVPIPCNSIKITLYI